MPFELNLEKLSFEILATAGSGHSEQPISWPTMKICKYELSFGWRHAGFITIWGDEVGIHLLPSYEHWQCGYAEFWHDGPYYSFGLGPLLLVTWDGI